MSTTQPQTPKPKPTHTRHDLSSSKGIHIICHNCGRRACISDVSNIIIYREQCTNCTFHVQSLLTRETKIDIQNRIRSVHEWLYFGNSYGNSFLSHYVKVPAELDQHLNLLEDTMIFAHHILLSNNAGDRCIAVVNFCKLRGSRLGFTSALLSVVSTLFEPHTTRAQDPLYDEILQRVDFEAQVLESGEDNIFATARSYLGCFDKLKETAMYKKLYKLLLYILSTGLLSGVNVSFESLNFSKFEAEAVKRTHRAGVDMFQCMLDTILFVCDRGMVYMQTGDKSVFLQSGSSYEKWIGTANRLIRDAKFLSNPEPHGINKFAFVSDLKDAIEKGKSILRFTAGLDKFEKTYLARVLSDLQLIESEELTRKNSQMPRKDPFAVLVHGSSSICKSQLKQILFYHYGKYFDLPTSAEYMYTRCPTDEYWSGFNSTQWCIVMDDIAFLKPNGEVDPTLKEMLQVKNSVPYCPPQAALEDKGRTPVRAELLIGTTNTKDLNLHAYFACPFAIARRLSYIITAHIKPQYSKQGFMADSKLIPITDEGTYMNIWDFEISIPVPGKDEEIDAQQTKYTSIAKFHEINDLLAWYIGVAKEHAAAQSKALNADTTMSGVEICKECYRSMSWCACEPVLPFEAQTESETTEPEEDFSTYPWDFQLKLWFYSKTILAQQNEYPEIVGNTLAELAKYHFMFSVLGYVALFTFPLITLMTVVFAYTAHSTFVHFWTLVSTWYSFVLGDAWKYKLLFTICGHRQSTYKMLFKLATQRVKKNFLTQPHLTKLSIFLTSVSVVFALKTLWNQFMPKMAEQSTFGTVPTPMEVEKPTFYYQDPYINTGVEISGASKCVQDDNVSNSVRDATAKLILRFDNTPELAMATTAFNVHGTIWMLNKHALREGDGKLDVIIDDVTQNVSRNISRVTFEQSDIRTIQGTDLAFIEIRALPPGKSMIKYFPLEPIKGGRYGGKYHTITKTGVRAVNVLKDIHVGKCPVFGIPGFQAKSAEQTISGDCGSIALADIGAAQVLIGSHTCANSSRSVFAQAITQKMVHAAVSSYKPQVDVGPAPISAGTYKRKLVPLHHKSAIRFIPKGTATVMGSFDGYRPKHKSKVSKTFIRDYVTKDGEYEDVCGAPDMTWKPWNLALTDMTKPDYSFKNSILDECEEAFLQDILNGLGDKINQLQVYTQDVALNGAEGVTFVDRLNISTSAGNPFKKSKKHFITLDENNKITGLNPVIQERINDIEETYASGKRYNPQFCAHLKDEPTPMKKVLLGKTRVFTGGEFAWSVVCRKFLLSHIRIIQNNPFVFEAMPGVVAQSVEWWKLYRYITKHGLERMICGDYGKFDKKMCAAFILAAFNILIGMAKEAGWNEEQLTTLRCIGFDTAFAHIDFNGDYISVQGNPSGHPLTVIINCLVNSLYMRYAYRMITTRPLSDFQKLVALATYGDDNAMGVSAEIPEFNHTSISQELGKIGVVYTMAEKEAESVPYIHVSEASFLKRKFVFDHDIGAIVAPLEHASIHKMLTSCLKSGSLSHEAHSICVIETAMREYFFYGKERFLERRAYFQKLIDNLDLSDWVRDSTFPTYSQLVRDFWMRFGDTENAEKYASMHDC
ncbi:hypothetical protein 1 [Tioga picorna-like virus 1]|uniref:hypothetical protein 1 n=1 Tax=Tioga picorna-like virus 1 TaxID=2029771 RepID=UPI000BAE316B|nr:hypothetical protein 1 [Tioga picorna-like virus 1]ASV51919.1 hypothetical protein 1 [Tioga picorna-like virus 1]